MRIRILVLLAMLPLGVYAQGKRAEDLKRVYFNLYTDSIKTVLNYYVNVEGEYRDGSYLPLDTNSIVITADNGSMVGNEWRAPKEIHFEKVSFRVRAKGRQELHDEVTVWLKRGKDPRDEMNAEDMEMPDVSRERRGRRR